MTIAIIAAMTANRVIGRNNALLPYKIPGDMKRFVDKTKKGVVIMGRKTLESIGKSLPDRLNIVVSKTMKLLTRRDYWVARSLEEAILMAKIMNVGDREIMVIGGGEIYKQAIPFADRIYLTVLNETWEGDTFFPKLDETEWVVVEEEKFEKHSFLTYERVHQSPV